MVVGSGPGGYTAAFRAADLGLEVTLIERHEVIGGVCLNVGCIPSKALLHAAKVLAEAEDAAEFGISFSEPEIDVDKLRSWKEDVVGKLTGGLDGLAKRRKVNVVHGEARFLSPRSIDVAGEAFEFDHAIIAAGSRAVMLPGLPDDERIVDSTGALELPGIPESLLVIGGGIIGLEMASVYEALGIEGDRGRAHRPAHPGLRPGPREAAREARGRALRGDPPEHEGRIGRGRRRRHQGHLRGRRRARRRDLRPRPGRRRAACQRRHPGLEAAGVEVDDRGEIPVGPDRRTNVSHIYAIGDITGAPMLAHKATHEGKVAAERIAGHEVVFEPRAIPSVAYTDPEVAWCGADRDGGEGAAAPSTRRPSSRGRRPGGALSLGRAEGLTKLLVDPESRQILGAGIVGPNAGELIAEVCLAMEMGADAEDVGLTIHPHPTLSETVAFAAEMAEGTITDLYAPKKRAADVGVPRGSTKADAVLAALEPDGRSEHRPREAARGDAAQRPPLAPRAGTGLDEAPPPHPGGALRPARGRPGEMRIGDEVLTLEPGDALLVDPDTVRQPFNDTDADQLWLVIGRAARGSRTRSR